MARFAPSNSLWASQRGVDAIVALALAALVLAAPARADEPAIEFLRAAQARGYGEVSLDYLEHLRAAGRIPPELQETWDLELSRGYRAAVPEAFNAAEAEARQAKSQSHLEKFLKEHSDHPAVAGAIESTGDMALDRALENLRRASGLKDAAPKEKHLAAARAALEEARPRFADAVKRYGERLNDLRAQSGATAGRRPRPTATMSRKQRQMEAALVDAELAWLDCRFKSAKIDFYLGQSIEDRNAAPRKAALETAAKAFDAVFQSYRESLVGLHAHLWHGRSADELGNNQLALDIYDEVLATAPEGRERESGLEPIFANAQYYRLLVIRRMQGFKPFLEEADAWLQLRRAWRTLDAYQGVALEVARTKLEHVDELAGAKKGPFVQANLAALAEIARTRSQHQQEAILLRRQYTKASAGDLSSVKSFDEGYALGESAAESLDWPAAAAALARAIELKNATTDKERLADALSRLDFARYQIAAGQYAAGKYAEALASARQLSADRPEGALAPQAASLAISAALSIYASAQDKQQALDELTKLAKETIERWPDKAEADDARIALGQASLVQGKPEAALAVFESVNPRSLRYPAAMHQAGQTHWRLYAAQKSQGAADPKSEHRTKAEQQLRASLEGQRKTATEPMSRQMLETQLLLAEVVAEGGQTQPAVELVEPLVAWVAANKPQPLDNTLLRVFLSAARAQLAAGQTAKAAATANLLFELGPDDATTNGVLVSIVKLVADQWKQAKALSQQATTSGDAAGRATADSAAAERKKLLADLLVKLAPRKNQSLAAQVFIADTSVELEQIDAARGQYQAILAQGDADPAFKRSNTAALTRIRTQLVGLIRAKAKTAPEFQEGIKQVDALIAEFPNALEPKMEKGRLLQAWADVDPARSADAVAQWTMLRTRLSRAPRKPPEYYEVIYNAAQCLFMEGLKSSKPEKALQAEQLLNATLVLSPRLNGPEQVAQYKDLLHKARQLQGRPDPPAKK